ncbi:cytochrome P450 [Sphaerisporangium corydalis]|uniref:Cytochrome P450 n=1 Tax=Sphaerisporangium corydalis TaxID=1441875 RepID=A0ABV9EIR3_9ACTN|nr:cytochrome P450 [Sphaerisporangium corydalis]
MTETPLAPTHIRRDRFDPVPELARLRAEEPVSLIQSVFGLDREAWLITRYEDVREVLGDASRFSNKMRSPFAPGSEPEGQASRRAVSGVLIGYDPPDHTRLRRLLTPEFTMRRMRRMEPRVEAIVAEHLQAMEDAGPPADLVKSFALPIPSLVICELLGVPYGDREAFQRRSSARLNVFADLEERVAVIAESQAYMGELVARQRANPGDDMIGMLVREHGDQISDAELIGVSDLLLIAGHETTSNMLGLGTLLLLLNPDQLAQVRDGDQVDQAVEELLRYLSIVHTVVPRTAKVDVELSGQKIKAGETLMLSIPSANRDPAFGEDLDQFDPARELAAHLAFGHGIHHCLGAPLARMEMRIAFPALLKRFPSLRLAVPVEEIPFRSFSVVYGVESLPVAW